MSIEIDILNGKASWAVARPLLDAVWSSEAAGPAGWRRLDWAHADLRVLIEDSAGLACHVGIYFRTLTWNGHKMHVGGIGGVATRPDCRRRGYATLALEAAIQTLRANEAARFGLLFCEPAIVAFYEARHWHRFVGEVFAEQTHGRIRFDLLVPMVFEIGRAPRHGTIDLCGLPW